MKKWSVALCTFFLLATVFSLFSASASALDTWEIPSTLIYPKTRAEATDTALVKYSINSQGDVWYYPNDGNSYVIFFDDDGQQFSPESQHGVVGRSKDNVRYNLGIYSENLSSKIDWIDVFGYVDASQQYRMTYSYNADRTVYGISCTYQGTYYNWDFAENSWYYWDYDSSLGRYTIVYTDIGIGRQDALFQCPRIVFTGETLQLCGLCELDNLMSVVANGSAIYNGQSFQEQVEKNMHIRCENDHGIDSYLGHKILEKDEQFSVKYFNQGTEKEGDVTNAGSVKVTVTGLHGHQGTLTGYFNIVPQAIQRDLIKLSPATGSSLPHASVTSNEGTLLQEGVDYTVSYTDVNNSGSCTVTVKGIGNYNSEIMIRYENGSPAADSVLLLPDSLTAIGEDAFSGIAASRIIVPDACVSIASRAFASCPNLVEIEVPRGIQIASDAFSGSSNVNVIYR